MATIQQVEHSLSRLEAVYPFRVARTPSQMEAWLDAYYEDLREYPIEAIEQACQKWRRGDGKKFPLIGELLPLVRQAASPRPTAEACRPWAPATDSEYNAMTLREKIREQKLLAMDTRTKAGPMWRDGGPLTLEQMPPAWHRLVETANQHFAEAQRLWRKLKDSERREAA